MPRIGDFPVCTCATSNLCLIHKPSGEALGSNEKDFPFWKKRVDSNRSVFLLLDCENLDGETEAFGDITNPISIHTTLEGARKAALKLMEKHLDEDGDAYEQTDSDPQYVTMFINEWDDYIAILEMTLEV